MPRKNGTRSPRRHREGRAVGYARRSTDRQEQSIPDQKRAIEQYCERNEIQLLRFYIDDAISGTKADNRPGFQEMIATAKNGHCDFEAVVVYDVKRFGRLDNDEAGYYRHILKQNGVEVAYVSEGFNGSETDDLIRPVKQWQARQESKDLSKVTIRGLMSRTDGGWWMGGVPPIGYDLRYENDKGEILFVIRFMSDGSKQQLDESGDLMRTLARGESISVSKRDRCRLFPGEATRIATVKAIFRMYASEGKGYKAIAMTLNADGVPTARGPDWSHIYSGKWSDSTIRAILVNPIYAGDMVWNRRTDARFHRISDGRPVERAAIDGHRLVPNDETDWVVVRDAHTGLIDRRLWLQAKNLLESKVQSIEQRGKDPRLQTAYRGGDHGKNWRGQRSRFILSGLVTCELCGSRYQGVHRIKGKKRADGSRVKTFSYGCGGYITKGKAVCQMNPIPQEVLETAVINEVLGFYQRYLEPGGKRRLAEAVRAQLGVETDEVSAARERIQTDRRELDGIIGNLLDNLTAANREFVDERLSELRERRDRLKLRDEELEQLELAQASIDATVEEAMEFLSRLEITLRRGLPQERLVSLRQCVERICINARENGAKLALRVVPGTQLRATVDRSISFSSSIHRT